MIIHGNKQISEIVYARKASEGGGAVRLTNIIRGAQVVFGGLYPYWKLLPETKAAILAAFGQTDGKAVIKATNAYLNALAATDKNKASALAGFINEDPMLVCSLGLQPQGVQMPERSFISNGQLTDFCITLSSKSRLEIKATYSTNSNTSSWSSFMSLVTPNMWNLGQRMNVKSTFDIVIRDARHTVAENIYGIEFFLNVKMGWDYIKTATGYTNTSTNSKYTLPDNIATSGTLRAVKDYNDVIKYLKRYEDEVLTNNFVPFLSRNGATMLDIEGMVVAKVSDYSKTSIESGTRTNTDTTQLTITH